MEAGDPDLAGSHASEGADGMSQETHPDVGAMRRALSPRASEFVDAHLVIGLHAETEQVLYYAEGPRRQQRKIEDALIATAAAIEREREQKRRRKKG